MKGIKYFDTENLATKYKRRLRGSKNMRWVVQGNSLVKILRKKPLKKDRLF